MFIITCLQNTKLTAGAIYIVRDPRDVLYSASKHFDLSIEETKDILFNKHIFYLLKQLQEKILIMR